MFGVFIKGLQGTYGGSSGISEGLFWLMNAGLLGPVLGCRGGGSHSCIVHGQIRTHTSGLHALVMRQNLQFQVQSSSDRVTRKIQH